MTDPVSGRVRVKVCGIRTGDVLEAAVASGVDAVGFVFAESVRRVSVEEAEAMSRLTPAMVSRVGVFLRPRREQLREVVERVGLDLVQADVECAGIVEECGWGERFVPVYRDGAGLEEGLRACTRGVALVEGARSGVGSVADWGRIARARRGLDGAARLILAGGLTGANVGAAVRMVRPYGVDVSSGVESSPGVKDAGMIRRFIAEVLQAGGEDQ